MAVVLPAAHWTVIGLGLARILPLWACALILTPTSYAHYTLVHESIHGNLAPGHPRLRWLNTLVGWVGALGLAFNWPIMMRGHALHHAHTNTDQDPDIHVKGTFAQLLAKWLVFVPVSLLPPIALKVLAPAQYRKLDRMLTRSEMLQASLVSIGVLALAAASIPTGHVLDWLCLLFIPSRVAALILQIFFSWLPHHPFDRTERYLNTRISLWPGGSGAHAAAEPAPDAPPLAERALLQLRPPLPAPAPHPHRQGLADRGADGGASTRGIVLARAAGTLKAVDRTAPAPKGRCGRPC